CMDEVVVTADEVRAFRARLVETSCSDANPAELVELLDELEVVKNVASGLQARGGRAGSGPPRGGGRTGRPGRPAWQRGCGRDRAGQARVGVSGETAALAGDVPRPRVATHARAFGGGHAERVPGQPAGERDGLPRQARSDDGG